MADETCEACRMTNVTLEGEIDRVGRIWCSYCNQPVADGTIMDGNQVSAFSESHYFFQCQKCLLLWSSLWKRKSWSKEVSSEGIRWIQWIQGSMFCVFVFSSLRSAWLALPASLRGHFSFVWSDFLQVSCCSAFLHIFLASRRLLRRLWQGWFWKLWIEIQSMEDEGLQIATWKWYEVLSVLTLFELYHFDLVGLGAKHVARVARHARGPKVNARRCDGFAMDNPISRYLWIGRRVFLRCDELGMICPSINLYHGLLILQILWVPASMSKAGERLLHTLVLKQDPVSASVVASG